MSGEGFPSVARINSHINHRAIFAHVLRHVFGPGFCGQDSDTEPEPPRAGRGACMAPGEGVVRIVWFDVGSITRER